MLDDFFCVFKLCNLNKICSTQIIKKNIGEKAEMLTVSDTDTLNKTAVDKKEFCLKDDTVIKTCQIGLFHFNFC